MYEEGKLFATPYKLFGVRYFSVFMYEMVKREICHVQSIIMQDSSQKLTLLAYFVTGMTWNDNLIERLVAILKACTINIS